MFIVAKENPKTPEGWAYFKNFEVIDNQSVPINTIIFEHAQIFHTKEEAIQVYWLVCQYFHGYKVYPYSIIRGTKKYV